MSQPATPTQPPTPVAQDRREAFHDLRRRYPVFRYLAAEHKWGANHWRLTFRFVAEPADPDTDPEHHFAPSLTIPAQPDRAQLFLSPAQLDRLALHLGLIEALSYWKATCSPTFVLHAGRINHAQRTWWGNLFLNGLGEFFFRNGLDPTAQPLVDLQLAPEAPTLPEDGPPTGAPPFRGRLIPVGGGKDSCVTLDLLKAEQGANRVLLIKPTQAAQDCATQAGFGPERILTVGRQLDPHLLHLNQQGYLNGHTPFSALVAFVGVATAALWGMAEVPLSNESSANEATVPGTAINHQYSKTYAFEEAFIAYNQAWLEPRVAYYSLLRKLNEYQIARHFAGLRGFHKVFRSCNVGSKTNSWCGNCPKCLFTWVMLAPHLPQTQLEGIWGSNLWINEALLTTLDELMGQADHKPFECVGTVDEVRYALACVLVRWADADAEAPLPPLLARARTHLGDPQAAKKRLADVPTQLDAHAAIPPVLLPRVHALAAR